MTNNCSNKFRYGRTAHRIVRGGLLAAVAVAASGIASAQDTQDKKDDMTFSLSPNPATPAAITPPAGNSVFLAGHAVGTQRYVCLPTGSGASWTVNNARPQATLLKWPPLSRPFFALNKLMSDGVSVSRFGRPLKQPPVAIPALEAALGAHPCGALSSLPASTV